MMRSSRIGPGLALIALIAVGMYRVEAQQPGAGEKIGERLDDAASAVKRTVGKAGDAVKEQYSRAKSSVHALSIEGRVYSRLHWEKSLQDATLDVSVSNDGTATLTGSVADLAAKATAVDLTGRTVGVVRVVNQLTTATAAP